MQVLFQEKHRRTAALVVAAGSSSRMGKDKMWLDIQGISVLERTLLAFEAADTVDDLVIVTRPQEIARVHEAAQRRRIGKLRHIVAGGDTRQQSVAAGIAAVGMETAFICIHDGARPLILPADIDAVNRAAWRCGAAALAVKVKDTVKIADADGVVVQTPPRHLLWQVQTPQVFDLPLFAEAMEAARRAGEEFTDDCQLFERAGRAVQLCQGSYGNIKITTPEDVFVAQAILKGEGR